MFDPYTNARPEVSLRHDDGSIINLGEQPEVDQFILDFQLSEDFKNLAPIEGAFEVLSKFKEEGFKIVAISAALNHEQVLRNRRDNLNNHFPGIFDRLYHTTGSQNKPAILKKYPSALWVEDNLENAVVGKLAGHLPFFMLHDRDIEPPDGIIKIRDWYDLRQKYEKGISNLSE